MERVKIYHPDLTETKTNPVSVTRQSFERSWSKPQEPHRPKGWRLWTPDMAAPSGNADREAWAAYAELIGVSVSDDDGRDAIKKKIEEHEE